MGARLRPFQALLRVSLKEFTRDRTSLSFTIILPLLMVAFFGFALSGNNRRLQVAVPRIAATANVAPDSRLLRRDIAVLRALPDIAVQVASASTDQQRLQDGSADVVLAVQRGRIALDYARSNGAAALAVIRLRALLSGDGSASAAPMHGTPDLVAIPGISNGRLDFVVPGILATAIMWLGIFAAIPLVQQREEQVLRRFAVTPLSRSTVVTAQVVSRLIVSLGQAVFVFAAARILFGVPIGARLGAGIGAVAALGGLVILGAVTFVSIGYAVAALSSTQSHAHAWAQLLTMPMLVLAGVFFPITLMPGILRPLAAVLPLTYLADALRQATTAGEPFAPILADLLVLLGWTGLGLTVAIRYFRWSRT